MKVKCITERRRTRRLGSEANTNEKKTIDTKAAIVSKKYDCEKARSFKKS